jgi:hypothetical protein
MTTSTRLSPIERAMQIWPDARPSGGYGWYSARCTGHQDTHASLSFRERDDGSISLNCHAGCERDAIIAGAGITERDLHPKGRYRPQYQLRPKYELIPLAADKLLPWKFLFNEGVTDGYKWHGMEVVQIPYYDITGEPYSKVRVRTGPSGNKDSFWDEDTPGTLIPYGYQWLDLAREQGYLLIGEGESDGWTNRYHNVPYLGVPGANNTQCLDGRLLNDIPAIYVIQEPDQAGQGFYRSVHKRLRATGYTGAMFALPWQKLTSYKDPNELHRRLCIADPNEMHARYQAAIHEAMERATPAGDDIELSVSEMDATEWVPRHEYEELNARYHDVVEQRDFILAQLSVPNKVMLPTDKVLNIRIDHEIRTGAPNPQGYVRVNMGEIARKTGLPSSTMYSRKRHLMNELALYEQTGEKYEHIKPDGSVVPSEIIFLKPTVVQKYPRFYSTEYEIPQRGGNQRGKEKPTCPLCGSDNVDTELYTLCHHCHEHSHLKTTSTSDYPIAVSSPTPLPIQTVQAQETIAEERATFSHNGSVLNRDKESPIMGEPHVKTNGMPELPTSNEDTPVEKQLCARCGEIWNPALHPISGRKICACHVLSLDELKRRKTPTQASPLFESLAKSGG